MKNIVNYKVVQFLRFTTFPSEIVWKFEFQIWELQTQFSFTYMILNKNVNYKSSSHIFDRFCLSKKFKFYCATLLLEA